MRWLSLAIAVLIAGCGSVGPSPMAPTAPTALGVIRCVPLEQVTDSSNWGPELDFALEVEFWDLISNSAHGRFDAWYDKVSDYLDDNPEADPRLTLLQTAGAVFRLSVVFEDPSSLDDTLLLRYLPRALEGAEDVLALMPDYEPGFVFAHNNIAMRALVFGAGADQLDEALEHLALMVNLEFAGSLNTEGRAAAAFTYGMIYDEDSVRFAIDLNEDCATAICNWTSRIAPFKPIGQLMMEAELHAVLGDYAKMNELLDVAEAHARERNWPFIERIAELRSELPSRSYEQGLGFTRAPMPLYSNRVNCSNCHIGGHPGQSRVELDSPYPNSTITTPRPTIPDLGI